MVLGACYRTVFRKEGGGFVGTRTETPRWTTGSRGLWEEENEQDGVEEDHDEGVVGDLSTCHGGMVDGGWWMVVELDGG